MTKTPHLLNGSMKYDAGPAEAGPDRALRHGDGTPSGSRMVEGPAGRKPRKALSRRNILIYGTLIVVCLYYLLPLYVMIVTSLKGMPEIRLGNIFSPPVEITFQPWVKAWAEACTGLNCDGLQEGDTVHGGGGGKGGG